MSISVIEGLAIARALSDAANLAQLTGDKVISQERLDASFAKAGASLDKLEALIASKRKAAEGADGSNA